MAKVYVSSQLSPSDSVLIQVCSSLASQGHTVLIPEYRKESSWMSCIELRDQSRRDSSKEDYISQEIITIRDTNMFKRAEAVLFLDYDYDGSTKKEHIDEVLFIELLNASYFKIPTFRQILSKQDCPTPTFFDEYRFADYTHVSDSLYQVPSNSSYHDKIISVTELLGSIPSAHISTSNVPNIQVNSSSLNHRSKLLSRVNKNTLVSDPLFFLGCNEYITNHNSLRSSWSYSGLDYRRFHFSEIMRRTAEEMNLRLRR
jgi:hypothetical protein